MTDQMLINIIIAVIGAFGGFIIRTLWEAVKDLQASDKALADKVGGIEILVAGNYITRPEFKGTIDAMFSKLDKIADKIDSKADK